MRNRVDAVEGGMGLPRGRRGHGAARARARKKSNANAIVWIQAVCQKTATPTLDINERRDTLDKQLKSFSYDSAEIVAFDQEERTKSLDNNVRHV